MLSILALSLAVLAAAYDHGSTYGGSGPYKSYYFEDATLPNHTLYQPLISAFEPTKLKLPVVVWGNGGCDAEGLKFRGFLGEIASHGALCIATGAAFTDPETYNLAVPTDNTTDANVEAAEDPGALTEAMDWITANAGKGNYQHVDASRIAVWGQSCGGLEAYQVVQDERVGHLGIFNSGELNETDSEEIVGAIEKPIFYFIGGPTDIAYENAEQDWTNVPATTPAWMGNHNLGHSGAFDYPNAGIVGVGGTHLMQWLLRGNETAAEWFTDRGVLASYNFTDVKYQNLDDIVTPKPLDCFI